MNSFAQRLKQIRLNKKLSQAKIAADIGVSDTQYQNYEYGKSEPTLTVIIKMCEYFQVSADWLLGLSDIKERR
jgi:transcriptional regulator with XRE-family HTH domain